MKIVKADGTREDFSEKKIIKTCIRAGASEAVASDIARFITSRINEGSTTHDIYKMILSELDRREDRSSILFRLREAISLLDSEYFEQYVKKVLEADGYQCEWNVLIRGLLVEHQVDIIAKDRQTGKLYLVECKRHVNQHRYTGLGVCLQVHARLEDLRDGFENSANTYNFEGAWLVTNGKFSEHAKMYAHGKNIRLTGWRYQDRLALENLIHTHNVFPLTMLRDSEKMALLMKEGFFTVQDFLGSKISEKPEYLDIRNQARRLFQ